MSVAAIHDINSLGVERMIRALSLLQPPLTSLVTVDMPPGPAPAPGAASAVRASAATGGGGGASTAAAAAAAAALAAIVTSVPTVSGSGPSAVVLAALLTHPEIRGERGCVFDRARSYYGLLLVPPDEVVRAAGEMPGRFLYAEWMALLQASEPSSAPPGCGWWRPLAATSYAHIMVHIAALSKLPYCQSAAEDESLDLYALCTHMREPLPVVGRLAVSAIAVTPLPHSLHTRKTPCRASSIPLHRTM